jgi:hypothetical protein
MESFLARWLLLYIDHVEPTLVESLDSPPHTLIRRRFVISYRETHVPGIFYAGYV